MAKEIKVTLKLQIPAGKANPAPPVGPALGQHGINIGEFVSRFNAGTATMRNDIIPVIITVYTDRSFDLAYKTPPASDLLRKAAGVEKGAGNPITGKVGKINRVKLREIAERKMEDVNANDVDAAMKIVAGTARSMGIDITD